MMDQYNNHVTLTLSYSCGRTNNRIITSSDPDFLSRPEIYFFKQQRRFKPEVGHISPSLPRRPVVVSHTPGEQKRSRPLILSSARSSTRDSSQSTMDYPEYESPANLTEFCLDVNGGNTRAVASMLFDLGNIYRSARASLISGYG